ncbi:MAG: bifunctional precorrin-2 dehydrogenase/sirohydrochlorin ferrochelatase [Acutalibacteraceae bacterium]|nr:bifunctional precorrin-2 dehydrogenase/sirohydrochlorin ferrochelatase [Acutalibacteraceae bacterium]
MGYFPFYIDIENKNCVVVGGGTVALRKIGKLLPFNPVITVIAPKICDVILNLSEVKICKRKFEDNDIDNAFMVISATDDEKLNAHIFRLCNERNILVNTVEDKQNCGFIFPALVKKKNITVGISTSGKSPLYARYIRENIENLLDDDCDEIIEILNHYRQLIKSRIQSEEKRKNAFEEILRICLNNVHNIDEKQVLRIIEEQSK